MSQSYMLSVQACQVCTIFHYLLCFLLEISLCIEGTIPPNNQIPILLYLCNILLSHCIFSYLFYVPLCVQFIIKYAYLQPTKLWNSNPVWDNHQYNINISISKVHRMFFSKTLGTVCPQLILWFFPVLYGQTATPGRLFSWVKGEVKGFGTSW